MDNWPFPSICLLNFMLFCNSSQIDNYCNHVIIIANGGLHLFFKSVNVLAFNSTWLKLQSLGPKHIVRIIWGMSFSRSRRNLLFAMNGSNSIFILILSVSGALTVSAIWHNLVRHICCKPNNFLRYNSCTYSGHISHPSLCSMPKVFQLSAT